MKMQKIVFALIGLMLFFAGQASAQQVKTDYDRSANFAQYKTYSWEHVKTQDALDVDRIKTAVNSALAAKGWIQVDSGGDVSIVAVEITRDQQTLNTFYNGFGGGWGWRRFGGDIRDWSRCPRCGIGRAPCANAPKLPRGSLHARRSSPARLHRRPRLPWLPYRSRSRR